MPVPLLVVAWRTATARLRLACLDIGLVACRMSKAYRPLPACDLYVSPLFRAARAYAERRYGPEDWLILSARHSPERAPCSTSTSLTRISWSELNSRSTSA